MRASADTFQHVDPKPKDKVISVQLLVIYPPPKNAAEFDRAYREEHLPYAGPRLVGATGVTTKHVLGAPAGNPFAYAIMSWTFQAPKSQRRARNRTAGRNLCSMRRRYR